MVGNAVSTCWRPLCDAIALCSNGCGLEPERCNGRRHTMLIDLMMKTLAFIAWWWQLLWAHTGNWCLMQLHYQIGFELGPYPFIGCWYRMSVHQVMKIVTYIAWWWEMLWARAGDLYVMLMHWVAMVVSWDSNDWKVAGTHCWSIEKWKLWRSWLDGINCGEHILATDV